MISRATVFLRKIRRRLGPSKWAIRFLRLPKSEGTATARGLVMVQIDGLSRKQLNRALDTGEMPFVRHLITNERYGLHAHYSGMPSSTPAVQGELFYGVKGAVPAFSFYNRQTGKVVRMLDPAPVAEIEAHLEKQGTPLLKGGSAYSNVYTGGAGEPHFCASGFGWGMVRGANPFAVGFLILSNFYSFVRTAVLLIIEFFLALYDCTLGLVRGRDLFKELTFVSTRVAICILLRELVTIGAKVDIARGLAVIHVNFIGYDEQAHRRGPSSKFAHWALKGIDNAVARIWRATKRSLRRDYDVWVYSDHGQEECLPYPKIHGRTISEAVARVFEHLQEEHAFSDGANDRKGIQLQRARLLGGTRIQKLFPSGIRLKPDAEAPGVTVTAMGPLGFVYLARSLGDADRDRLADALVRMAGIPLVLAVDGPDQVKVWTPEGIFRLPGDEKKILGRGHPFLEETARDLIALCRHPNAGELVISGWRANARPFSFPVENGCHGGPGREETNGFAVLPGDCPLARPIGGYLRPVDLRQAAFATLALTNIQAPARPDGDAVQGGTLRVMTYNVHSCIGMDGKHSPERIARVIAQYAPDIVALQELDAGRARTGSVHQARIIAQALQMAYHFHPVIHLEEGQYGNAVLTHLPIRLLKARELPGLPHRPRLEPRGALWTSIDLSNGVSDRVSGRRIQFLTTHLGLRQAERRRQVDALLGEQWLDHPDCRGPVILCGDFNSLPFSSVCRRIGRRLTDAQKALRNHRPRQTWFGAFPAFRIDHVFFGPAMEVLAVQVASTALARLASDHLPLIVDLRLVNE